MDDSTQHIQKSLHVIHLRGSQAEMGAQYGQVMLDYGSLPQTEWTLTTLGHRMLENADSNKGLGRVLSFVVRMLTIVGMWLLHRHRPAAYRERTLAFLKTVGSAKSNDRHMLLMDTFQNLVGLAGRYQLGPFSRNLQAAATPACSSLAVWGDTSADQKLRHARNFDFPCIGIWEDHPTVVFCTPDDGLQYGFVGTLGADVPGTTGFNEAGLTIAAHTRFHEDGRFDGAGIVDLCHEIIRKAENIDDAIRIANERPVAANWGLCISSAQDGRAITLETSGSGVRVLEASTGTEHITAANLHNHPELQAGLIAPFPAWNEHSSGREQRLQEVARTGQEGAGLDLDDLMAVLGDTGSDNTRRAGGILAQAISVSSVVFEPESRTMVLSVGETPTGFGPFVQVDWDWDAPVGHQVIDHTTTLTQRKTHSSGNASQAYDLWRAAVRAAYERHDDVEQLQMLEGAIVLDPTVPSYRLMAGLLHLRQSQWERAITHFEVGLKQNQSPFRTGQFLLWLSRSMTAIGREEEAEQYRHALLASTGPHVESLKALALKDQEKPVSQRRLRRLQYSLDLVDAAA